MRAEGFVIFTLFSFMIGLLLGMGVHSCVTNNSSSYMVVTYRKACEELCLPNGGLQECEIDGDCTCNNGMEIRLAKERKINDSSSTD
jgi:hypothetical protein